MNGVILPCEDGTDRGCCERLEACEYSQSYDELSLSEQEEVQDLANSYTREDGDFEEEIGEKLIWIALPVCAACGSDNTRDSGGNVLV